MKLVISFADEASSKNLTEFLEMPISSVCRRFRIRKHRHFS
ncbi:hypothetical protein TREVI0001_0703 [Treponema vincentii ATCC 35580]|uniref:Uncharacterized protein n=1 Tax=Treponema vincentii ATCC 35580 TaxID=596324 RepID=C8PMT3_9SPIR|nr:hypothetical protein TREVI0001_0703 [Treponema vincentii ATCC 35580]